MSSAHIPVEFENRMGAYFGAEEVKEFLKALDKPPKTFIRINPFKSNRITPSMQKVPWCDQGYLLDKRPIFTLDPLFHAGSYYVQESSSMFLQHILHCIEAPRNGVFLDLAAAPGGKSTLLSSYLGENGFLVANEVIKARANILKENIIKWGLGNTLITQNDPEHFERLGGFFDLVMVDAPCSGEGMFRKDVQSRSEWSLDNIDLCAARQERILDKAAGLVKAGGFLIYSTCTFNEKENEEMIRFIASEFAYEPVKIPVPAVWNILETETQTECGVFFSYRFFPHRVDGEGFFVTVLRRSDDSSSLLPKKIKDFKHPFLKSVSKQDGQKVSSILGLPPTSAFYQLQESYFWLNTDFRIHFEFLSEMLNIKYFGVELGKFNKDQFIPTHEWALSTLPKTGYKTIELNLEQALAFLRKEEIENNTLPLGWLLVTY